MESLSIPASGDPFGLAVPGLGSKWGIIPGWLGRVGLRTAATAPAAVLPKEASPAPKLVLAAWAGGAGWPPLVPAK